MSSPKLHAQTVVTPSNGQRAQQAAPPVAVQAQESMAAHGRIPSTAEGRTTIKSYVPKRREAPAGPSFEPLPHGYAARGTDPLGDRLKTALTSLGEKIDTPKDEPKPSMRRLLLAGVAAASMAASTACVPVITSRGYYRPEPVVVVHTAPIHHHLWP